MPRHLGIATALLPLSIAACGSTPTAPSGPTAALTLDRASPLFVPRHETRQLQALFGLPGGQQDVTSAVTWRSSNPHVATVEDGLISAVDLGVASIAAEYRGQRQTLAVTVRRRTLLVGAISVADAAGRDTITELDAYVNGREAATYAVSGVRSSWTVRWGGLLGWLEVPAVDPGGNTVSVAIGEDDGPDVFTSDASSYVIVEDMDTGQALARIPLPVQSKSLANGDRITWTVQIEAYSS